MNDGIKNRITTRRGQIKNKKVKKEKCGGESIDMAQLPPCLDNMINSVLTDHDSEDMLETIALEMCNYSPTKSPTIGYGSDLSDNGEDTDLNTEIKVVHLDDNTQCVSTLHYSTSPKPCLYNNPPPEDNQIAVSQISCSQSVNRSPD